MIVILRSRKVVAIEIYRKLITTLSVQSLLDNASKKDGSGSRLVILLGTICVRGHFGASLTRSDCHQLDYTVTILAFLVRFKLFFDLNAFFYVSNIEKLRVFHAQVL